ncbi:MAG: polyprenyl synthetase family protein [Micrococcales bacterium]|nr:polyprenyl synthetase family protein [Micrococcales bacterium]MCL2668851.1 polyprenyl synthetase family protein [Micrococcales bacterium]
MATEDPRPAVDEALAQQTAALREVARTVAPQAEPVVDVLEQMLNGGKRLRASFTYWGWRVHGGEPGSDEADAVVLVAAAHELFQAAALIHDDVLDNSDTRRGKPAVHHVFAASHRDNALMGDPGWFGDAAAILLGDLAMVACDAALASALRDHPQGDAVRDVFNFMRAEVELGQYLDLFSQARPWGAHDDDETLARQVIRTKSARYSVEHPLAIGALMAGADDDQVAACRAIGLPLGEAFQLRDDVLGMLGDPHVTGKPTGDDLLEGKRTIIVARAAKRARTTGDEATLSLLAAVLGNRAASPDDVARLTVAIETTGAIADVEAMITRLSAQALALIDEQGWPDPAASALRTLAQSAVARRA